MIHEYFTEIWTFLAGGGLASILAWYKAKKQDKASFDQRELEKYQKENLELRMAQRMIQARNTEPPIIRWKLIDGKFSFVSNTAMMSFFEPLEIKMSDIMGKTMDEVFSRWPEIYKELILMEAVARKKTKAVKVLQLYPLGKYFTLKVQYYEPSIGIIYECELVEEKAMIP